MSLPLLKFLDVFFLVFHAGITLFNLTGWAWRFLRKWNLLSLLLTGSSWFLLGIFLGWGYCPLTDWHFRVLRALGETDLPNSYLNYLVFRITGYQAGSLFMDRLTLIGYFLALILSVFFLWKDRRSGLR